MEGQKNGAPSQSSRQSAQWSRLVRRNTLGTTPLSATSPVHPSQLPPHVDFLPQLLPLHSASYEAQLQNYNKLISSGSGRTHRVFSSPLPTQFAANLGAADPRTSSLGSNSNKISRSTARGGHGSRKSPESSSSNRPFVIAGNSTPSIPPKKLGAQKPQSMRTPIMTPTAVTANPSNGPPSTPRYDGRNLPLESRECSPNAMTSHSPRSACSESNTAMASIRTHNYKIGGCKYETAMAHGRRRMAYNIGSDRLEKSNLDDIKASLTDDEERRLCGEMQVLHHRLLPSAESDVKRLKLVNKLELLLNTEWPGHDIRVHIFGSSGNLLYTEDSDVDICITTEWKELEEVCLLADVLARSGMQKVVCVSTAKVPIVKAWDPELELACDLNVNNTLALENTRMIRTYVQIDERVRPLAMIIKHWTRKRIVNDAAFGGTLSSYTWICLIINFLQTREPPILPSLHQRPHQTLRPSSSSEGTFADDIASLKGFGKQNQQSLAALLFHFFRFYAHEMDYDKCVVSVRRGKLISKTEKAWHLATNNMLCVEEPFNIGRNLGNTADDTSFRGLHQELRRAFDLVASAALDTCCEEYQFPKEEEKIWEKPPPHAKLVLSRSASQSGRSKATQHVRGVRNGNSNARRFSSSHFDHPGNANTQISQNVMSQDAWLQSQHAQVQLHTELYTQLSQLKAQENNLRNQLYQQNQQYLQMQAQAYAQAQRAQMNGESVAPSSSQRHRGNSVDQPPLSAPLRPDMFFYPMLYPTTNLGQQSPSTYPSSPIASPALPDITRAPHRMTVTNGVTQRRNIGGSTVRSHSQPAARSLPQAPAQTAYHSKPSNSLQVGVEDPQHVVAGNMPNFFADESTDPAYDHPTDMSYPHQLATTKLYRGFYIEPRQAHTQERVVAMPAIPVFGDIVQHRRRGATDQFPPSFFNRVRRHSRSSSPLGLPRPDFEDTGGVTEPSIPGPAYAASTLNGHSPLVVNGSTSSHLLNAGSRLTNGHSDLSEDLLDRSERHKQSAALPNARVSHSAVGLQEIPVVLDGSGRPIHDNVVGGIGLGIIEDSMPLYINVPAPLTINTSATPSQTERDGQKQPKYHAAGFAKSPEVKATSPSLLRDDCPHLSPVREVKSPSPTVNLKLELAQDSPLGHKPEPSSGTNTRTSTVPKAVLASSSDNANGTSMHPGHRRGSKSDGSTVHGWQKPRNKKKSNHNSNEMRNSTSAQPFCETLPIQDSERKGG